MSETHEMSYEQDLEGCSSKLMNMSEAEQDAAVQKKKWTRVGVPKFQCLVCGDGAYGNNFGLVTCESCKAFFRRQLNRPQRPFKCPTGSKCLVTSGTRKYCPACRLQKCFEVGMRPDIGETRRQRKRERERLRRERASNRTSADLSADSPSPAESEQHESSQSPCSAFHAISSSSQTLSRVPDSTTSTVCNSPLMPSLGHPSAFRSVATSSDRAKSCETKSISDPGDFFAPLPADCFSRLLSICSGLAISIQEPFEESELSVLFANQSQFASALPQTFTELQGIREAIIKRFIRFTKTLEEFRDRFAFDERVAVLKRTLLACYVLHFGYSWDSQRGSLVRLANGHQETINHQLVCMLKRKSGMDVHDSNHSDYAALHGALRQHFPQHWPIVIAALSLATLFSPEIGSRTADYNDCKTASLSDRLACSRKAYLRFIVDYVERFEFVPHTGTCMTRDEKQRLLDFCEERISQAYTIGEGIAERLSTAIRLDPNSATKIIPLLTELKSC